MVYNDIIKQVFYFVLEKKLLNRSLLVKADHWCILFLIWLIINEKLTKSRRRKIQLLEEMMYKMDIKPQTVIKMTVVKKNGHCPIFPEGDQIVIKKHCLDTEANYLTKYCYATLTDIYPKCNALRKQQIGTKDYFACRENGIIEIELERMEDELYNYERKIGMEKTSKLVIRQATNEDQFYKVIVLTIEIIKE